jgi:hypothetical protein
VAECVQAEGEEGSRTLRFELKLRSNGNDVDPRFRDSKLWRTILLEQVRVLFN